MPIITLSPAVRQGAPVLIALYGESGSGKTYSALKLARGLVGPSGKIAMLDTETGRGRIYANLAAPWDHAELSPPFTPERYIESLKVIEGGGYDVLIIDSASHEWEGIGGVLDAADAGTDRNGRQLQGLIKWAKPKAAHKRFVQALLRTRMHVIVCLRAKEKLIQSRDNKEIHSEGFVSIQDKRFIFEVTVQLFLHNDPSTRGTYTIEKCPEDLLPAFPAGEKISEQTGARIAEWVRGGAPVDHDRRSLVERARDEAGKGTDALRHFFEALAPAGKLKLKPELDNLKSIAAQMDKELAAIQDEVFGEAVSVPGDAFGEPAGKEA